MWHHKFTSLIDHIRTVSLSLIYVLVTFLSLDEMMIQIFDRTIKTHWMKNKPIKKGYNFLVLTINDSYIYNLMPGERSAISSRKRKYLGEGGSKIESMVMFVVTIIKYL